MIEAEEKMEAQGLLSLVVNREEVQPTLYQGVKVLSIRQRCQMSDHHLCYCLQSSLLLLRKS